MSIAWKAFCNLVIKYLNNISFILLSWVVSLIPKGQMVFLEVPFLEFTPNFFSFLKTRASL